MLQLRMVLAFQYKYGIICISRDGSSVVEQRTFNPLAEGSNPSRPTKIYGYVTQVVEYGPC